MKEERAGPGLFECLPHVEEVTDDGDTVRPAGGGLAAEFLSELRALLHEGRQVTRLAEVIADQPADPLPIGNEPFGLAGQGGEILLAEPEAVAQFGTQDIELGAEHRRLLAEQLVQTVGGERFSRIGGIHPPRVHLPLKNVVVNSFGTTGSEPNERKVY